MPPISILLLFILLINLASSTPSVLSRRTPQQYYLHTSLVRSVATNDNGTPKGSLYLQSYHTGASLSDVTLTPNISDALSGTLNSTIDPNRGEATWITNLIASVADGQEIFWDVCAVSMPYANWGPMQINLGETACDDFYADGDLLVCAVGEWLVCDWWHGVPQLFFITAGEAGGVAFHAPSSCSVVDLQMVFVDEDDGENC